MATNDPGVLTDFNFNAEAFQDTLQAELVDKLAFQSSGILSDGSSLIDRSAKGQFVDVPQFETLADDMTQVVSATDIDVNDFADYKMRGVWVEREAAWGIESLVQTITGKDPLGEIARQIATKVAKTIQTTAINVLNGIFAVELASTHSTGTTYSGAKADYTSILGAKQLLGDSQMKLNKAIANSKVVSDLVALNMAQFPNTALATQAAISGTLPMIAGMQTWMEDAITAVSSVYSTYFSAPGQLLYVVGDWNRRDLNGNPVRSAGIDVEYSRKPQTGGGQDLIYVRVKYLVHPAGMQYNSATANPTDAQLATGSNWTKVVDDDRKIRIVEMKTL